MICVRGFQYCNCDTCAELRLTPEDLFQLCEDERAEFEATFGAEGYCLWRGTLKGDGPFDDYGSENTGHAWKGWLAAAGVQWVPAP